MNAKVDAQHRRLDGHIASWGNDPTGTARQNIVNRPIASQVSLNRALDAPRLSVTDGVPFSLFFASL